KARKPCRIGRASPRDRRFLNAEKPGFIRSVRMIAEHVPAGFGDAVSPIELQARDHAHSRLLADVLETDTEHGPDRLIRRLLGVVEREEGGRDEEFDYPSACVFIEP